MGGCLSVEVIAESAPSSPFGNVTSTTPRSRAHSVASSPGGNQRFATGFSPRTPREAGDGSEAEGNGAGGRGVAGGGGKFRRGAGKGKRVGSGVGGAKAVSSGGGRGGGGEGGEGGWGRGAERQGGPVGRGNGRGGGGDGYGGGGNLAAPQSVPVEQAAGVPSGREQAAGVPSDATSTNSGGLSAAQSTSSDPRDGRGTARKFRLHELRAATSSFSKKAVLGRGSFGEVYLGKLGGKESKEVVEVAVKKLNPESSQGLDEWLLGGKESKEVVEVAVKKLNPESSQALDEWLMYLGKESKEVVDVAVKKLNPESSQGLDERLVSGYCGALWGMASGEVHLGRCIWGGASGNVYLGKLGGKESKEVVEVAVKKQNSESSQGLDEWLVSGWRGGDSAAEEAAPSHPNLVEFIGYCAEKGEGGYSDSLSPFPSRPTVVSFLVLQPSPLPFLPPQAEIVLLRKLHHPNLVELIGYCAEKGEALLVYGLCPNGSLDDRLFPRREVDIIDWPTRVRIAQGAAQGLLHLHENKVIHRDLKPSNILLDQDMQARITDFGMAKQSASSVSHISTRVMGTMGYLDPEYMETGCLRDKSDVYSLGVILLQVCISLRWCGMGTMGYLDPEYMETGCLRDKSDVYSLGVILLQ
ncbi:unnamed protein product, partial [Closterium sp. NIES-65]